MTAIATRVAPLFAGVFLGFLLWLAINPALAAILEPSVPAFRAFAVGHWNLGWNFVYVVVAYYPFHLLFLHSEPRSEVARKLLRQAGSFMLVVASFVFVMEFHVIARWIVPLLVLGYAVDFFKRHGWKVSPVDGAVLASAILSIAVALTDDKVTREALCVWFVLPLYWFANLVTQGGRSKAEILSQLLLYLALATGMLAITAYGGDGDGKRHLLFHAAVSYAFVTIALVHAGLAFRAMQSASRLSLSVGLFATLAVVATSDVSRLVSLLRIERALGEVDTNPEPIRVSEFTELRGYAVPANLDPDWFSTISGSCGDAQCHMELSAQHEMSAHAHAMDSSAFKVELASFIADRGRVAADHCLACHAPLGVIEFPATGSVPIDPLTTSEPSFAIGVGCVVCHRAQVIEQAEVKNASLAIKPLWLEERWPLSQIGSANEFVKSELDHHKKMFRVRFDDWESICGSCHVVSLPASLAASQEERVTIDQHTSFLASPYARAGLTCRSCHQQRYVNTDGYPTVGHMYLGSGASLPYADKGEDQVFRATSIGFLSGLGDIGMDIKPGGLPVCLEDLSEEHLEVEVSRYSGPPQFNNHNIDVSGYRQLQRDESNPFLGENGGLRRRDLLAVSATMESLDRDAAVLNVSTTNVCIGHSFPSGEGIKGYLEVLAYDASGRVVGRYGGLDADGFPVALPTTLGVTAIDGEGQPIVDRSYWNAVSISYARTLEPGEPAEDVVEVKLTADEQPVAFEVGWYYLRPEYFRSRERGLNARLEPVLLGAATVSVS